MNIQQQEPIDTVNIDYNTWIGPRSWVNKEVAEYFIRFEKERIKTDTNQIFGFGAVNK